MATRPRRNGTVAKIMPLDSVAANSNVATSPSRRGVIGNAGQSQPNRNKNTQPNEKTFHDTIFFLRHSIF
ncbi:MAG: hypothetical protein LBP96_05645, partial [Bacteroidales bacterium]|nr:hypothetical protein [Bacteroidales bacterium]